MVGSEGTCWPLNTPGIELAGQEAELAAVQWVGPSDIRGFKD